MASLGQLPDGSSADIPASHVNRSQVIEDVVAAADANGTFVLTAPEGCLQSWIACVALLETRVDVVAHDTTLMLQLLLVCRLFRFMGLWCKRFVP